MTKLGNLASSSSSLLSRKAILLLNVLVAQYDILIRQQWLSSQGCTIVSVEQRLLNSYQKRSAEEVVDILSFFFSTETSTPIPGLKS